MLYDMKHNKTITMIDCLSCEYYNKRLKKCEGLGIKCNEIDPSTMVIKDAITGLPVILNKGEQNGKIK